MHAEYFGTDNAALGFLWASRPSASLYSGKTFKVLDSWATGLTMTSDGTYWKLSGKARFVAGAPNDTITGTTSRTAFREITIPGGLMGTKGSLNAEILISLTNNANTKNPQTYIYQTAGGLAGGTVASNSVSGSSSSAGLAVRVRNTAEAAQILNSGTANGSIGTTSIAVGTATVNTAADWIFCIAATPGNAGDTQTLLHYNIEIDQRF